MRSNHLLESQRRLPVPRPEHDGHKQHQRSLPNWQVYSWSSSIDPVKRALQNRKTRDQKVNSFKIARNKHVPGNGQIQGQYFEKKLSSIFNGFQELESDHFQLKQRYQKISDLKDELEEDYTRVKEEAQKVPRLQKQLEALQDSLEISKTKVSCLSLLILTEDIRAKK